MAVVLALTCLAHAGELQDDLAARRARVMDRLGPEAMLVLFSAPTRVYSADIDYEYRQDSNLYYLTGIDQAGTTLVLMPGNASRREILFVAPPNPAREHWDGPLLTKADAAAQSGIQTILSTTEFDAFIGAVLARKPYGFGPNLPSAEHDRFFGALRENRARIALLLPSHPPAPASPDQAHGFAARIQERFPGVGTEDVSTVLRDLRRVKTPYEQRVLERSVEISSEAHRAGMRAARPGAYEYEVEAAIEQVFRARGASGWGYPSIVGSGPNGTILHYMKNDRRMEDGDLVLVDAAASYQYMTGDITRTYPVNGRFTRAQQDLYELVLDAQTAAVAAAAPGARLSDLHARAVEVLRQGLMRLGLITDASGDQYRLWSTHVTVHYIGLDVHDVGRNDQPLEPGVAFVIEPGIYVRQSALDLLPSTPQNVALRAAVRPAVERYRDLGVRVEDSFLMTSTGLKRLSGSVPRTVQEVESFLKIGLPPVP
jgi:Xaa-Pro aminopeptidase